MSLRLKIRKKEFGPWKILRLQLHCYALNRESVVSSVGEWIGPIDSKSPFLQAGIFQEIRLMRGRDVCSPGLA